MRRCHPDGAPLPASRPDSSAVRPRAGTTAAPGSGDFSAMVEAMAKRSVASEGQKSRTQDMAIMRALAHPSRLALLEHLGQSGPATATECAEVVQLSPSATSYHLRALARVNLVEDVPQRRDGRERLWRRSDERYEMDRMPSQDPEMSEVRRSLIDSLLAWDAAESQRFLARIDDEPAEWQQAALIIGATLLMTAAELQELNAALQELLEPYKRSSRANEPAGARMVSFRLKAFPA